MRGLIEGLETPHPIGLELPGLFHDDDFSQRFTAALDEVIAPIFLTLDAIEAYVDPWLAPEDFLTWLSEWLGIPIEEDLDEQQRAHARRPAPPRSTAGRGRRKGIADLVECLHRRPARGRGHRRRLVVVDPRRRPARQRPVRRHRPHPHR